MAIVMMVIDPPNDSHNRMHLKRRIPKFPIIHNWSLMSAFVMVSKLLAALDLRHEISHYPHVKHHPLTISSLSPMISHTALLSLS